MPNSSVIRVFMAQSGAIAAVASSRAGARRIV
jgi:hypothetical protein